MDGNLALATWLDRLEYDLRRAVALRREMRDELRRALRDGAPTGRPGHPETAARVAPWGRSRVLEPTARAGGRLVDS